jgi:hypothetical protein
VCSESAAEPAQLVEPLSGSLSWQRQHGEIVFAWGDEKFGARPESARSKWYKADLDDPAVRRAAMDVARRFRWPCTEQEIAVKDDALTLLGFGKAEVVPIPEGHRITVHGSGRIRLPQGATIEDRLDSGRFRQCLATEGIANLDEPKVKGQTVAPVGRTSESLSSYGARATSVVPGLRYASEFITESEEKIFSVAFNTTGGGTTIGLAKSTGQCG